MSTISPNSDLWTKAEELRRLHHDTKSSVLPTMGRYQRRPARRHGNSRQSRPAARPWRTRSVIRMADQIAPRDVRSSRAYRLAVQVRLPPHGSRLRNHAEEMEVMARELLEAGAVGLNLEDNSEEESVLLGLPAIPGEATRNPGRVEELPLIDRDQRTYRRYWWRGTQAGSRLAESVCRANAFAKRRRPRVRSGLCDPSEIGHLRQEAQADQHPRHCENSADPRTAETRDRAPDFGSAYRTAIGAFANSYRNRFDSVNLQLHVGTSSHGAQNNALHQRKTDAAEAREDRLALLSLTAKNAGYCCSTLVLPHFGHSLYRARARPR